MSVIVVGLSHRSAPLDLLERFSFTADTLQKGLHHLHGSDQVTEGAILSTCNRVEVYAVVGGFHTGVAALRRFLADSHHVAPDDFSSALYALYDEDAVRHLFGVAAGIDSMVLGESQILAQVREAFRLATEECTAGPVLSAMFRHAIKAGRRARAETRIGESGMTFATAGAMLARRELGGLEGSTVLVIGAGKVGDLVARRLAKEGATILVANRSRSGAVRLAERAGGTVVPMADLDEVLARSDLVLSSTGSPEPVLSAEMVAAAMARRPERRLILLDMAVPRDVEPAASSIDGVTVWDLDDLREALLPSPEQLAEVERVKVIVEQETPKFAAWERGFRLAPLLEQVRTRAEGIRRREIERAAAKLGGLEDDERDAVDALTKAIVAKLLHRPVTALKDAAGSPEGDALARVLRELFGSQS